MVCLGKCARSSHKDVQSNIGTGKNRLFVCVWYIHTQIAWCIDGRPIWSVLDFFLPMYLRISIEFNHVVMGSVTTQNCSSFGGSVLRQNPWSVSLVETIPQVIFSLMHSTSYCRFSCLYFSLKPEVPHDLKKCLLPVTWLLVSKVRTLSESKVQNCISIEGIVNFWEDCMAKHSRTSHCFITIWVSEPSPLADLLCFLPLFVSKVSNSWSLSLTAFILFDDLILFL